VKVERNRLMTYNQYTLFGKTLHMPEAANIDVLASSVARTPVLVSDDQVHDWYTFVLSFPPALVREYLRRFAVGSGDLVLDPFCGTGTTLVECKKQGVASVGVEATPMAAFACKAKVHWSIRPELLLRHAKRVAARAHSRLSAEGITDEPPNRDVDCNRLVGFSDDAEALLIKGAISPLPLHKAYRLLEAIRGRGRNPYLVHELLALARILPTEVGNLRFGPEVGIGRLKEDAAVVSRWLTQVENMARDLSAVQPLPGADSKVIEGDSRDLRSLLRPASVSAVFTSPPYPNEKDYTRVARLESVMLGFFDSKEQLRQYKQTLVRSNTRSVYKADDDDAWVSGCAAIEEIAEAIEARRVALGKTSGFERLYPRLTKLYFGGMKRHFANLRHALKPGAMLGYVVGDQASYLRVMIRTGELLAELAESVGYDVVGIDLFRTRMATATKSQLREEVLLLRWPG